MALQAAEEAVLTALERELLDPEILEQPRLVNCFSGIVCSQAVASPTTASWNRVAGWLKQVDNFRQVA